MCVWGVQLVVWAQAVCCKSATTAKDDVGTGRRATSQLRRKRFTKVCVWRSLTYLIRLSPAISGIKHPKNHNSTAVSMTWGGGKLRKAPQLLSSAFHVWRSSLPSAWCFCHLCCVWWIKALLPEPLGLCCPGFALAVSLSTGWQAQPVISSCAAAPATWCNCSLPAQLWAMFGVQLRACSTTRQDTCGEPQD